MTPPFVFIVILQYNNSEGTLRCLQSVKELNYPNFRTIVVDNASKQSEQDNIREYVKSQLGWGGWGTSKISLIFNPQNLGYAGGNNVGIKHALSQGADYVFILNNDTTTEPDCLEKLVKAAEADPKVGIVGPAIKEGDGRVAYYGKISWLKAELKHVCGKSEISPLENSRAKSRGSRVEDISDFPHERNLMLGPKEYVIGAAMLVKKEALQKTVGLEEVFFLYFEDADFSQRLQVAGYKLKIVPEAVVHHEGGSSTSKLGSPLLLRYHMRNALIFNSLHAPWLLRSLLIFWAGWILLKNLVKVSILPAKETVGEAIVDGVLDFYKNKGGKIEI